MEAKKVMLAQTWDETMDPTGYWISEKLDGVRAYWTGKSFYTRQGKHIAAVPEWFTKNLPSVPLDGELWGGRGTFQKCAGLVKRTKITSESEEDWKKVGYLVFDAPAHKGKYEERLSFLKQQVPSTHPYAKIVGLSKCKGKNHLLEVLKEVTNKGGEGLMLRKPGSLYEQTRSYNLLKVKTFFDEEAIVVDYQYKEGSDSIIRHLECRLPNGQRFSVGSGFTDEQRRNPPKKGSIITIKYFEIQASGKPRFPTFLREREELVWADVLNNAKTKPPNSSKVLQKDSSESDKTSILFTDIPNTLGLNIGTSINNSNYSEKDKSNSNSKEEEDNNENKGEEKPICKYGEKCYRNNEEHLQQFQHPWREKKETTSKKEETSKKESIAKKDQKKSINAENKPVCKYGANCYQKKADHLEKFFHPPATEEDKDATQEIADVNTTISNLGDDTDEMEEIGVKNKPQKDEMSDTAIRAALKAELGGNITDEMSDEEIQRAILLQRKDVESDEETKEKESINNHSHSNLPNVNVNDDIKDSQKKTKKKEKAVKMELEEDDEIVDNLPTCIYDADCTRKNPQHFKEFAHPLRNIKKASTVKLIEKMDNLSSYQKSKQKKDSEKQKKNDEAFQKIIEEGVPSSSKKQKIK